MMRLRRASLLVVAFSLLTTAATAYAECAWVMWEQTEYFGKDRKMAWTIEDAYATQKDCATALRVTYLGAERTYGAGKSSKVTYHGKDRYSVWDVREGQRDELNWTTRLWCLPSVTDPRPR